MSKKTIRCEKGFLLTEALVAIGILTAIISASLIASVRLQNSSASNSRKAAFATLSSNLMAVVSQQNAWDMTKSKNSAMACSTTYPSTCANGTGAAIALYNVDGLKLTDPGNPAYGFTADGEICNNFDGTDKACRYRANVRWSVHCSSAETCQYPEEKIEISFQYGGPENFNLAAFNILPRSRTNLAENQSPIASCAQKGKIYIGFGRSLADGDEKSYPADPEGCVSMAALRGKTGPSGAVGAKGATGDTGAMGPQGPAGPNGKIIWLPTTDMNLTSEENSPKVVDVAEVKEETPREPASKSQSIEPAKTCQFLNQVLEDGKSVTAYREAVSQKCVSETRTCSDGKLSGSYGYSACRAPNSCSFAYVDWWQMNYVPHGGSISYYPDRNLGRCDFVRSRTSASIATCADGILSPSGPYRMYIKCLEMGSPLMVHLGTNENSSEPLNFTSRENGIWFNLLGDNAKPVPNTKNRISWYKSRDYYFIVKPNKSGHVLGINELFGDNTKGPDGKFAADGYKALAKYDGTSVDGTVQLLEPDNLITPEDPIYKDLRLWNDINFDGVAQRDELFTLAQMKIEIIDLNADPNFKEVDEHGNETTLKSVVKTFDGKYHLMFDIWFAYDLEEEGMGSSGKE